VSELLGLRVELVEASTGTESIRVSAEDFGIAATRFDLHPADRILRRPVDVWFCPIMSFMPLMAMDHVGTAAETHHEIKERGKHKEREYSIHWF
jgi:hypothetical protein